MTRTFYDVLGVSPDASQSEIRTAYRDRVKEVHPDVSDDPNATEAFRTVARAEEVLGDPDERARYDRLGHEAYVRRVNGRNAATAERSPWTAGDGTDGGRGGRGGRRGSSTGDGGTANAERDSTTGDRGASTGDRGSATGDGNAANDDRNAAAGDAAADARRTRKTSSRRRESEGTRASRTTSTTARATGDRSYRVRPSPSAWRIRTQESLVLGLSVLILYPILLYASLTPLLSPMVNVVVGLCTAAVVVYTLTFPRVGVVVFGAWSAVVPAVILVSPDVALLSLGGLIGLCATWIPFAFSGLLALVLRP